MGILNLNPIVENEETTVNQSVSVIVDPTHLRDWSETPHWKGSDLPIHLPQKPYERVKWEPVIDQPSLLLARHTTGKVSVGVRVGKSVYTLAKNLKQQQAEKLLANIRRGNIDLENLSEQKWEVANGGLTSFSKSKGEVFGEVFTESAKSIAGGMLGTYFFALFGPVPALALSLGMAAAAVKTQENSVGPGILAGTLTSTFGAVPALALSLGAAAAISKLCYL